MKLCVICERACSGTLCKQCARSLDRYAEDDGTVLAVIVWAARRARWFERRRSAKDPKGGT